MPEVTAGGEDPGQPEGPEPMDIDSPVAPAVPVHPLSAPPISTAITGEADVHTIDASAPGDGTAAAPAASVAASPKLRLVRTLPGGDASPRGAISGEAAAGSTAGQPGVPASGQAAAGRPEPPPPPPPVRVLPQRQGLHTPRGSQAAAAWAAPGPDGAAAHAAADAGPGSPRGGGVPSSPRPARSSGCPMSPRSPRAVTSPSDRMTRAGRCFPRFAQDAMHCTCSHILEILAPAGSIRSHCCAEAEAAKAAAEEGAKERERERQEALLQCAAEIRAARDAAARPLPAAPEPKRAKAHWDFLLEEMAWLAKEFQKCGRPLHTFLSRPSLEFPRCVHSALGLL